MPKFRIGFAATALALVIFGTATALTFDGAPATPTPIRDTTAYSDLDVQVHSRDSSSWFTLPAINAQHGADCSAPPATHPNTSYEGSVYQCANHIMTAINGDAGYAEIVLTPNLLFDFSQGGSVTWEMSTFKASQRDWWDVTISPFDQSLAVPLLSGLSQNVDLNGTAMNAIHVGTDNGEGAPMLSLVSNGNVTCLNNPCAGWALSRANDGIPASVDQSATRQPFKLTIANGRIRFERLASATAPGLVFWDIAATPSFASGVVQFGHHSYTPEKDGAGVPATWHWDSIDAQPSTQFTVIHSLDRYTQGGTIQFANPAPANAFLRFAAICAVKVNGQSVSRQPSTNDGYPLHTDHQSSYMVPIPQGSTSATIALTSDYYTNDCIAQDFAIWSLQAAAPQTSTPTSPMATATSTSTPSPLPTSTAVSTATPTATSTATRTPTPATYRCQKRNPNGSWSTVWTGPGGICP